MTRYLEVISLYGPFDDEGMLKAKFTELLTTPETCGLRPKKREELDPDLLAQLEANRRRGKRLSI